MTTNAEKLARELIALSERYSDRDFERAAELLLTGKLFSQALGTARHARAVAKSAPHKSPSRDGRLSARPTNAGTGRRADAQPAQLDLDALLGDADNDDRSELAAFATRMQSREILPSGPSVRAFAQQMGMELPKSIPPRPALVKTLIRRLREMPKDVRSKLIGELDQVGTGESSLKRWSDLIVRREPE